MNCKPGDLADIVGCRNAPELNGTIVQVVRAVNYGVWLCAGHEIEANAARWGIAPHIFDRYLRPIRDQDGEDQTLTWAGKPSEVTA